MITANVVNTAVLRQRIKINTPVQVTRNTARCLRLFLVGYNLYLVIKVDVVTLYREQRKGCFFVMHTYF
jgi:hypothetical protein